MVKKIGHIVLIVLAVLLLLNVVLLLSLNTSYVQGKLVDKVTSALSEKTGTKFDIESVYIDIFDGLFLQKVYVEDTRKDTLLFVNRLNVDYSLKSIYRHKTLTLKNVALEDFVVRLSQENDSSDYNFQFLVDAFSSKEPDTTASSSFKMEIGQILLKNGSFRLDVDSKEETPDLFNVSHLKVDSINALLSLNLDLPKEIHSEVSYISAKEKSGLRVRNVETDFSLYLDSIIALPELDLMADKTHLKATDAVYRFDNNAVTAKITESSLVGSDFQCFAPMLKNLQVPVELSADANVVFPSVDVNSLKIECDKHLSVDAPHIYIEDCMEWQDSRLNVDIVKLDAMPALPNLLKELLQVEVPSVVDSLLPCAVSLRADGSLPALKESLELQGAVGHIKADGDLSYLADRNRLSAKTNWRLNIPTLEPILHSDMVGKVVGEMSSDVDWDLKKQPNVRLSALISSVALKHYDYDTLRIDGSLLSDVLNVDFSSPDPNCRLALSAKATHFLTDSMKTTLHANIANFAPKTLHLADSIGDLQIKGLVNLTGTGMDYNQWDGEIQLDSFSVSNDSSRYFVRHLNVKQSIQGDEKTVKIDSPILKGEMSGAFDYADIYASFVRVMHKYLPTFFQPEEKELLAQSNFKFKFNVSSLDSLMSYLGVAYHQSDPITLKGGLDERNGRVDVEVGTPTVRLNDLLFSPSDISFHSSKNADFLEGEINMNVRPDYQDNFMAILSSRLSIRNDSIYNYLDVGTFPDTMFLKGTFFDCVSFHPLNQDGEYEVRLLLDSSKVNLYNQELRTNSSLIQFLPNRINISNLGFSADRKPLFFVDGTLSSSLSDSLNVIVDDLSLQTIFSLLYINDLPMDCKMKGKLKAFAVLGDKFRFTTRDFKISDIVYGENKIGNGGVTAVWDNTRKGVFAKAYLENEGKHLMDVMGVIAPARKYMKMKAVLDSVPLLLAMPFAKEYVSDLSGCIGANVNAEGEFSDLKINGCVHLKDAKAKVKYTGVTYSISDSMKMEGNHFYVKRFKIKDDNDNALYLNGDITHEKFQKFNYEVKMNMKNFAVLNNPKSRSNMVYGNFYVNGNNLILKGTESEASITGELRNAEKCVLNVNLPETVLEANSYDNIVYVKSEITQNDSASADEAPSVSENNFDLYANLSVELSDKATFNVSLSDGAMVRGNGNLRLLYEDKGIYIYNRYTVSEGYLKLRLAGLPMKKFTIQNGSYVDFVGDPMDLRFNATATYALTADLSTLSSSFSSMGLATTRVPVNCNLLASGSLNEMNLSYDVSVPKADEDVKQMVNSIINTDNVRIKEFAYLIGVGMFNDPSGDVQGNALMSFASSSLSSTLNNVLGNVLGDKVTLGTDFSSSEDFSDVEVGVSASTKVANDKLLLSANVGYQKNSTNPTSSSVLTDFDAEYLLGKTGMFRIKAYNHTNNDFYRANNTQGVGFSFVRESQELNKLFKIKDEFQTIKKREEFLRDSTRAHDKERVEPMPVERRKDDE